VTGLPLCGRPRFVAGDNDMPVQRTAFFGADNFPQILGKSASFAFEFDAVRMRGNFLGKG
jgi:hypothetical protein